MHQVFVECTGKKISVSVQLLNRDPKINMIDLCHQVKHDTPRETQAERPISVSCETSISLARPIYLDLICIGKDYVDKRLANVCSWIGSVYTLKVGSVDLGRFLASCKIAMGDGLG